MAIAPHHDAFDKAAQRKPTLMCRAAPFVAFAPGDIILPKRKKCWTGSGHRPRRSQPCTGAIPRQFAQTLLVPVRRRPRAQHDLGLSRRRHSYPAGPRLTEDVLRRELDDGARDGAHCLPNLDDRYAWLSGRACRLHRTDRAGAGWRPYGKGDLASDDRDMPKGLPQAGDEGS